jgi:hypothetical protein
LPSLALSTVVAGSFLSQSPFYRLGGAPEFGNHDVSRHEQRPEGMPARLEFVQVLLIGEQTRIGSRMDGNTADRRR